MGALLIAAVILAILSPLTASTAAAIMPGWFLLTSGVLQGLGLIAARKTPHAPLQSVSIVLALLIGMQFVAAGAAIACMAWRVRSS